MNNDMEEEEEAPVVEDVEENCRTEETHETKSGKKSVPPKDHKPSTSGQRHAKQFGMTVEHIFTQCSLKAVESKFSEEGGNAAQKEMEQLHCWDTFKLVLPADSCPTAKRKSLESLIFLKEKRWNHQRKSLCWWKEAMRRHAKGGSASPKVS